MARGLLLDLELVFLDELGPARGFLGDARLELSRRVGQVDQALIRQQLLDVGPSSRTLDGAPCRRRLWRGPVTA